MKTGSRTIFLCVLMVLWLHFEILSQPYNDGPIELRIRVREVQVNHSATDFSLGFSPDDFTFKVWAQDDMGSGWQGGQCLTFDFDPPGLSSDLNTQIFTRTYPTATVPQVFDLRLEAWEDDLDADPLSGACGGSRCTYTANACCISNPFGGCIFSEGDDNYCNSNPFKTGIDYRLGYPCEWYSHGYVSGGCGGNYRPRIESYWRYIDGDNCATTIDLGILNPGTAITHNNSTECYNNDYGDPGNDVFVRFNITQAMGVRMTLCGGATFNTTLFLLDGNCNQLYSNLDDPNCSPQSTIAENLCSPGIYYVVIDGSTTAEQGRFRLTIVEDPSLSLRTNITGNNVTCNGLTDGNASTSVTGGTSSYQYLWTPGNFTTSSVSGLGAGTYIVRVTDARSCVAFDTMDITQPASVIINNILGFDPICNGESTGEVTISSVAGGTPPYQYSVTGFYQPTSSFTGLAAGAYMATVSDAQGCRDTASVTLTDPPKITGNLASTPETCAGFSDGAITINPDFGTHPYYCALGFPPIFGVCTAVYSNLTAGTYYVTIRDGNDCEIIEAIDVDLVPALTLTLISKTNVNCNGGNDGEIRVSSTNGAPPRIFSIDGGITFQNDSVFTGLTADLYTVLVQDANGCENTLNVQVSEPSELTASELFQISVTCNGEGDGLMVITASGGTGPYRYSIDSVNFYQSGAFNYLAGGTYHFIVVDDHDCVDALDASMFEPNVLSVSAVSSTNASCAGINDGTLTLGATGGTAPFKFSINNGPFQTNTSFTGLTAGSYLIGVEDRNDCVAFDSATIGANVSLTGIVNKVDVLCNGDNTGSITIAASGGTLPYEYSINNIIFQPTGTFGSLSAGSYTAIARDVNGCRYIEPVDIVEPPALAAAVDSIQEATCSGIQDGAIYITPSGGNGSYSYSWSNSLVTEDIENVAGGNYTLTVRDGNNCSFTLSATIDQPNTTYIDVTRIDDVSCNGESNGYVDIDIVGGVPPFTYYWSDNSSNQDLLDVPGGVYLVTVTDAAGCEAYEAAEVKEPAELRSTITASNVSCATSADADIDLTVTGGTAPYDFLWSPIFAFTEDLLNVPAGTYGVVINDDNGCRETDMITIASAPGLTATLNITDISCYGNNDGNVEIIANGGTPPYDYDWSNNLHTSVISSLSPGIYDITVTDSIACSGEFSALIEEPQELKVQTSSTDVLCYEDNSGLAIPFVTGGTGSNTFLWNTNPPSSNPVQTNLQGGTYILEVRDENNCLVKDTVIVGQPSELSVAIAGTDNVICLSGTDGEVTIHAEGGVSPYEYSVMANRFQSDSVFTGLEAGDYGVMVIDENGCMATNSFTLTESDGFEVNLPPYIFIALGASDTIKPELFSNDSIIKIEWTPADFLSCTNCLQPVVTPTEDRSYTLVVTDINGCVAIDEVTVAVKTEYEVYMPNVFSPNGDGSNDVYYPIDLGAVRTATLKIFNRWGGLIYETNNINTGWNGTFKGELLMPGVFVYHITGDFLDGNVFDKVGSVTLIR